MYNFGVVGTNWISASFVEACRQVEGAEIIGVCSRKIETAEAFANENNISNCYTDFNEMLNNKEITAVYIASPNSLHYFYAKEAILKGKHVLCEKPFTSNKKELQQLIMLAKEKDVLLMEAIKALSLPSYHALKEGMKKIGKIRQVSFQKYQYSSRYDEYKAGMITNIFNPAFSGGALTDIGIYCVYPALDLFGKPKEIVTTGTLLDVGVDGCGTSLWKYTDFNVTIGYSKITNSILPSEIMGEEGSILIDNISNPNLVEFVDIKGNKDTLYKCLPKPSMSYEIQTFVDCLSENKRHSEIYSHELALDVMETLDLMREQLGVVYPADEQ